MNVITAIKAQLANSDTIGEAYSCFVVWDDYGMIIATCDDKDAAVDALFLNIYGNKTK